ncbi:MAG: DUF2225 domain-containing protein [Bacteroidales bacterium]|nr:DUF2225 domain-containing protein [Clostridium sp.]MCM1204412.1 DUF2225 domain-containing protein [Bacteroidales bacterium]
MGLFSGLEIFGFKSANLKIYNKEENKETKQSGEALEKKEEVVREEDFLFLKTYTCPVCDKEFKTLAVRAGKIRSMGQDDDLRPLYKEMDPIKYDTIICPNCGYGALIRYFNNVMPHQAKKLRAEVMDSFKGMTPSTDVYDYDEAITRYKMVLLCDVVGNVKNSRKAYTCLKMAWAIRGKLERESASLTQEEKELLQADEMECIQNAYEGYMLAFSTENFPMGGMDEVTVTYLTAELAYKLGKYKESIQLLSKILGNIHVSSRIKEKALTLKEQIREKAKTENN